MNKPRRKSTSHSLRDTAFASTNGIYNTDSPCSRLRCYLCKGSMASLLPFGVTGRSDFGRGIQASLWDAVRIIANPAINRRATVVRPSGTKLSKMSKLQDPPRADRGSPKKLSGFAPASCFPSSLMRVTFSSAAADEKVRLGSLQSSGSSLSTFPQETRPSFPRQLIQCADEAECGFRELASGERAEFSVLSSDPAGVIGSWYNRCPCRSFR